MDQCKRGRHETRRQVRSGRKVQRLRRGNVQDATGRVRAREGGRVDHSSSHKKTIILIEEVLAKAHLRSEEGLAGGNCKEEVEKQQSVLMAKKRGGVPGHKLAKVL